MRIHRKFQKALSGSSITLEEAQAALKSRDITSLDDRFRSINHVAS
jgi:hypothetical protein